ncbi:MAG: DUF3488 and transglutaminase-like domain-containing protein, partial [Actinomycetota bacterium]|nr:DUF3488 and transglutaminase-like domain-containing protein [Actinomycetota bacterium]
MPARPAVAPVEVALLAVTVVAVLGLSRLFSNASFLPPVLLAAVGGHGVAWAGRRLGLHPVAAAGLSLAGLALTVAWVVEPHTTVLGIPGFATLEAVRADLADAWKRFGEVVAPTASTRGFVLGSVVGAWLTATMADGFAFRGRARVEALVPSFTVFLFGAMLGADRFRVPLTAAYLAALVAFLLFSDASGRTRGPSWFGRRWGEGERALVRSGVALGLVAVVGAVVIGPRLPGADDRGLLGWRDRDDARAGPRVTVSPLVDIRGRLVEESDVELFTVRSETPTYWRLTSLDQFDGNIWSSRGTYQRARGELGVAAPTRADTDTLRQRFTVSALSSIWLPAAFRPERVRAGDGVRYDRDSASLLTDRTTSDGLTYTVDSELPRPTAEELAGASGPVPAAVSERYLSLPPQMARSLAPVAAGVTAGQGTAYGKARALQDWFRTNFTYSLAVRPGHGATAVETFLAERRGYCEQFAGTFAAMARALGVPARVAVGFTPGERGPDGEFEVLGRNAHAWPEVFLAGFGWVAFEPTPGRGMPGAEDYTDVAPQGFAGDQTATTTATTAPATGEAPADTTPATEEPQETAPPPAPESSDAGLGRLVWVVVAVVLVA